VLGGEFLGMASKLSDFTVIPFLFCQRLDREVYGYPMFVVLVSSLHMRCHQPVVQTKITQRSRVAS
jgi:hypothetical protein